MPWTPKSFTPSNCAHQSRSHTPDAYEDLLGDGLEAAFAQGADQLDSIAQILNERAVPSPTGDHWSPQILAAELARLGA